jgi:S1-C subfamily serine protease
MVNTYLIVRLSIAIPLLLEEFQTQITDLQNFNDTLANNDTDLLAKIQDIKRQIQVEPNLDRLLRTDVFVRTGFGEGAGTIIKKTETNMYILTCYHVIAGILDYQTNFGIKMEATVGYSKTNESNNIVGMIAYKVDIIKSDEDSDLALLKVSVIDKYLEEITIAETEPNLGETVYSIGSPLGLLRTISKGILSHKEDGFYYSDNTTTFGNSGGGLYNSKGELIGVPSNVTGYQGGGDFIPESSLGLSRDLQTIHQFLNGVEY